MSIICISLVNKILFTTHKNIQRQSNTSTLVNIKDLTLCYNNLSKVFLAFFFILLSFSLLCPFVQLNNLCLISSFLTSIYNLFHYHSSYILLIASYSSLSRISSHALRIVDFSVCTKSCCGP